MIRVAFILLTHQKPAQIRRLIHALNAVYEQPRIAIHHDFLQCPLEAFPDYANVRFVQPSRWTCWADFSLVAATVDALRLLLQEGEAFDWFAVLSGSDYPVKAGADARRELAQLDCDACMHYEEIHPATGSPWQRECADRYFGFDIPLPRRTPHGLRIEQHRVRAARLLRMFSPYARRFRCYAGSQWFSARAHVARKIVDFFTSHPWLERHLDGRACPDETYFQTVACNDAAVRVRNDNLRYIDWSEAGWRPKILDAQDLPAILASGAHFARKFESDAGVLDELDGLLGIAPL